VDEKLLEDVRAGLKARASITRSWNDEAYIVVQRGRCKGIRRTRLSVTEMSPGRMMKRA
jgi:hypothetical protein